jgi:hypothetical protein
MAKQTITNTAEGPRGVELADGTTLYIEPGQTVEDVDVAKAKEASQALQGFGRVGLSGPALFRNLQRHRRGYCSISERRPARRGVPEAKRIGIAEGPRRRALQSPCVLSQTTAPSALSQSARNRRAAGSARHDEPKREAWSLDGSSQGVG